MITLWRPAAVYTEGGVADVSLGTSDTRPAIRTQTAIAAEARRAAIMECAKLADPLRQRGLPEDVRRFAERLRALASPPAPQEETR